MCSQRASMGCTSSTQGRPQGPRPPETLGSDPVRKVFFLAVNGSSGGQVAQQLLDLQVDTMDMRLDRDELATVRVFSLKDNEKREAAFKEVASLKGSCDVRVVACGGDGTVKWVISCLSKVDSLSVPIGVIPFGTGNDLARVMGWGSSAPDPLIGPCLSALRKRIQIINDAEKTPLDVWLCSVSLAAGSDTAKFEEIKDKKTVQCHEDKVTLTQEMINYFSIGADGELMFAFEKNRKNTQLGNKQVYFRKGFQQTVAPPRKLDKYIEQARLHSDIDQDDEENAVMPLEYDKSHRQLLFLNIPSYGAGADPWKRSADSKPESKSGFTPQYTGDKILEVLSVKSTFNTGQNLVLGSTVGIKRVKQGSEFSVKFKPGSKVYFQVDGEALRAFDAESVQVTYGYQVQLLMAEGAKAVPLPDDAPGPANTVSQPKPSAAASTPEAYDEEDVEPPVETWRSSKPAPEDGLVST